MTDTEILELAKSCGFRGLTEEKDEIDDEYWGCWEEQLLKFVREIYLKNDFYKTRCELLQKVQKYMRDPERQIVCDILANNSLLPDPSGVRYGQDLMKLIGTYD